MIQPAKRPTLRQPGNMMTPKNTLGIERGNGENRERDQEAARDLGTRRGPQHQEPSEPERGQGAERERSLRNPSTQRSDSQCMTQSLRTIEPRKPQNPGR